MATKTPPPQPSSSSSSSSSSRRTCLCAPTTHPGSFRCARHRKVSAKPTAGGVNRVDQSKMEAAVAAATSKASLIKAILFQIIKPSSHDLQRRRNFRPKPSRFGLMNSTADGRVAVS